MIGGRRGRASRAATVAAVAIPALAALVALARAGRPPWVETAVNGVAPAGTPPVATAAAPSGAPASTPTATTTASPAPDDARTLLADGELLRRSGAYRSAHRLLEQAYGLARAGGDGAAEIDSLAALARTDDALGDAAAAAHERDDAIVLARALGDRPREAGLLADAGMAHARRAESEPAANLLRRALAMQEADGDRGGEAKTRSGLAWLAYKQGRYDEALADLDRAAAIAAARGDRDTTADARLLRGLVHLDRREHAAALAEFRGSLAIARQAGDVERQIAALDHVAIDFLFEDAPSEARAALDQALELARRHQDRALEMRVRHLLANSLREAGRHHEAIAEYAQVGAWCESEGDLRETAWIRFRTGKSQQSLGRLEDAERSWRAALGLWQSLGERRAAAWAEYDLARLLERGGRTDDALAAYEGAAAAQRAVALPYVSMPLGDLALLLARVGRPQPARATAAEAVRAADAVANPEMRWRALYRRGQVERLLGRPADALASLRAALDIIETMRRQAAPSDEARAGFMIDKQEVYAATVDLLVEMGRPGEALEVSERARARAFLDLVGGDRGAPPRAGAGDDTGGAAPLRAPSSETAPPPATPDDSGPRRGAPGPIGAGGARTRPLASEVSVPPLSLDGIRAEARRRRATILEYFTAEDRSFVFAVVPGGEVRAAIIPRGAAPLADRVAALRRELDAGGPASAALRELHDLLVAPVAAVMPDDPEALVVIVPHGALSLLPFAALTDPGGAYLVERHTLACAPAAGALRLAADRRSHHPATNARLLAVGNPLLASGSAGAPVLPTLPDADTEVRAVAEMFHAGDPVVLTGADATEARVRALAPGRTVLHFATHAMMDDADPLASRLLLAPPAGAAGAAAAADTVVAGTAGAADDGALTAGEIAGLRLEADLVTLSACDTGLGGATGEGIGGLARAFMHAGAATIVVSLWRVADITGREQMVRFYRAYGRDGLGPARALRRAQIDTIQALRRGAVRGVSGRPLPESPAFWAPFVVLGEPG